MNIPKVSIIVPCYNQAEHLDEALRSILNQSYQDWECLIVNDGSPDNTEEIAKKWETKDKRFIYLFKKNGGVSSARNFGIERAKGEYLQFLDSDDFLNKQKLELSLNQIEINKEVNLVISNFRMFTKNPENSTDPFCILNMQYFNFESMLYEWNERFSMQIQCGFFHSLLFKTIRFPENLAAQEDWIVWVCIFKMSCKTAFIDKPLALYRTNPNSRMMTIGLSEDHIKACEFFSNYLPEKEYRKFSMFQIAKYYRSSEILKNRLKITKESNTYQTGLLIKKVLRKLKLLGTFKRLFPVILKLKSK